MIPIFTNTYFSGAGLMDIGLEAGGLMLQQSFEIEALCCETMRRNFSHEVVQCDITKKLVQSEKECFVPAFLPARCDSKARALRGRECSGHEEVSGRHGSNDEAAGLLRTCGMSGEVFNLAAAKERQANHHRQPASLRLA